MALTKEKPVAMLLVTLDESTEKPEQTSHLQTLGPGTYKLTLRPNVDKAGAEAEGVKVDMGTIVAHELGHFAATIAGEPEQQGLYYNLVGPMPAERRAWQLAKVIKPDLDEKFAKWALSTYERRQ